MAPLPSDASLRRYYRVTLERGTDHGYTTVVAMCFDSVISPEAGGAGPIPSDRAYVELSRFLGKHGIHVPELYFDGREFGVLLIEDFGDRLLFSALEAPREDEDVTALYESAIEELAKLQRIPVEPGFFPFARSFTAVHYLEEMGEFLNYYLRPIGMPATKVPVVESFFGSLAAQLDRLPGVLAHRDYHSWNILVTGRGEIGVIDYQDALMAPVAYDIVALLNDRDTDTALGAARYAKLLSSFRETIGAGGDFLDLYARVLLQRDLKVVGRFHRLATVRGLTGYLRWVPGTLRRIGTTLARLSASSPTCEFREAYAILRGLSREIEAGAGAGPWF